MNFVGDFNIDKGVEVPESGLLTADHTIINDILAKQWGEVYNQQTIPTTREQPWERTQDQNIQAGEDSISIDIIKELNHNFIVSFTKICNPNQDKQTMTH